MAAEMVASSSDVIARGSVENLVYGDHTFFFEFAEWHMNRLAADHMSEFRKLFCPSQLVADAAQSDEQVDIGCGHERRHLRLQAGHPAEDVGFTAQLVQALHLRMISAEIAQEIVGGPTVVASRVGTECYAEGIDRAIEDRSQRMLEPRASRGPFFVAAVADRVRQSATVKSVAIMIPELRIRSCWPKAVEDGKAVPNSWRWIVESRVCGCSWPNSRSR
jgi:hypothetical protein